MDKRLQIKWHTDERLQIKLHTLMNGFKSNCTLMNKRLKIKLHTDERLQIYFIAHEDDFKLNTASNLSLMIDLETRLRYHSIDIEEELVL